MEASNPSPISPTPPLSPISSDSKSDEILDLGYESSTSFSSLESSHKNKVLIIQNYAGTGGTEGVAEQIIEKGTNTYSFCELVSSVLRFAGTEGKAIMTVSAEVYSMENGKIRKETELTTLKTDALKIEGGKITPKLRDVALKTGAIGELIRKKVEISGGRYYNLELAARTETTNTASTVGVLNEDFKLHEVAKRKLKEVIIKENPDVIYVAQDHATRAVTEVAAELEIPVVYGIHREDLSISSPDLQKNSCVLYNAQASKDLRIEKVIGCSASVLENFRSVGGEVSKDYFYVVENGVDFEKFQRNEASRELFRTRNEIPQDANIVTIAGRYSPEKDFFTFIRSAVQALKSQPSLHFVMCGSNVVPQNAELQSFLQNELEKEGLTSLSSQFHLLGFQDMPQVFSASDVVMSTSVTESWGLTLLEGAAAGNIVVHSDVAGMNNAMKDVTSEFRIKREEIPGETIGTIKSPKLTESCISEYTAKILQAIDASKDPEKVKSFVKRAKECSIDATVKSYESVFDKAIRSQYRF
jgi:glycosyltransferase involved in cell wall biosynthesis